MTRSSFGSNLSSAWLVLLGLAAGACSDPAGDGAGVVGGMVATGAAVQSGGQLAETGGSGTGATGGEPASSQADAAVGAVDSGVDGGGGSLLDGGAEANDGGPTDVDAGGNAPAHVFTFDSTDEWGASGFTVMAGACYNVTARVDGDWLDLNVEADLNGWADKSDSRISAFAPFRRVTDPAIGFYQLATCVDRQLEACFAVGDGATICPEQGGELFFFVNDVPGFESNNVGTATIEIQPAP